MGLVLAPVESTPYIGGNAPGFMSVGSTGLQRVVKSNLEAASDPSATDGTSAGYSVGSRWINVATDKVFECVDNTILAAIWKDLSSTSNPSGSGTEFQIRDGAGFGNIPGSSYAVGLATLPTLAVSDLTSGRIPFIGVGGRLQDSASFTYISGNVLATTFNSVPLTAGGSSSVFLNAAGTYSTITLTTPGGATGTVQYNNAGAFGGLTGSSVSGANLTLGGTLSATSLTASGLTSGRIPFVSTGGLLADSSTFVRDASTGNVGIGTTSPNAKLHVENTLQLGTHGVSDGVLNTPYSLFINIDSNNDNLGTERFVIARGRTGTTGGTELLRVTDTGNVLIGTATDDTSNKLQVNGSIALAATSLVKWGITDSFPALKRSATALQCVLASTTSTHAPFAASYLSLSNSSGAVGIGMTNSYTRELALSAAGSGTGQEGDLYYYNNNNSRFEFVIKRGGNAGFQTTDPQALIHGIKTTEQMRLGYDTTHFLAITDDLAGAATFAINAGSGAVNAIKLDASSGSGETRLQVFDVDTAVLKRVKSAVAPPVGSKLLYIDP